MKKVVLKVAFSLIILITITSCTDNAEEILKNNVIENEENIEIYLSIDPDDDGTGPKPHR